MRCEQRQGGTTAIEFALVFPVLFFLLYSTVIYSLVNYVKQSLNFAAQEAARAVVAVDLGSLSAGAGSTVDLTSFVTPTVTASWTRSCRRWARRPPARLRAGCPAG
jgi:hypothetical protein